MAELTFADICKARGFPVPPTSQYRVQFDDGSYTDADWAYPDKKVLVFIDGMGPKLHGDPKRAQRDKLLRAKARMKGYQVVVITAEGLQDETGLAGHFEELAMYVGEDGNEVGWRVGGTVEVTTTRPQSTRGALGVPGRIVKSAASKAPCGYYERTGAEMNRGKFRWHSAASLALAARASASVELPRGGSVDATSGWAYVVVVYGLPGEAPDDQAEPRQRGPRHAEA